jgi:hypothetical protein
MVKSCMSMLIVVWRNDELVCLPRLVLLKLVAPSPQPREVGLFSGTGCMVPQQFAAGRNHPYPEVLGRNQRHGVPGVNYSNTTHDQA